MQYTLYSLLRKHGEVMSEKNSKNHFVAYIQNGNCHMEISILFQKIIKIAKNINEKYFLNDLFSYLNVLWPLQIIGNLQKIAHAKYELRSANIFGPYLDSKISFSKIVFFGCNSLVFRCFKHVLKAQHAWECL